MSRYFIYFTISVLFTSFSASAQEPICGSIPTEIDYHRISEIHKTYKKESRAQSDTLIKIPVMPHFFRKSNGSGGYSERNFYNALDIVNDRFSQANIEFYVCNDINYIDSDRHYDFDRGENEGICDTFDIDNVLNIYFANTVFYYNDDNELKSLCGYAYFSGHDRIIMKNSCADNGSTLAHEIGHYLQLLHTHDTRYGNELVDASNCDSAGDLICDTPADPRLSYNNVSSTCIYTGTTKDDNDDYYRPDPTNIMSYSRKPCRNTFSQGQYDVMRDAAENYRSYLTCSDFADISAQFYAEKENICVEERIYFRNVSSGYIDSVEWYFEGGTPSTSTSIYPNITYNTPGQYDVQLIVKNLQYSDTLILSDYITVHEMVIELDTVGNTVFCEGDSVILKVGAAEETRWRVNTMRTYEDSIVIYDSQLIELRQTDNYGCTADLEITTTAIEYPSATLAGDSSVLLDEYYIYTIDDGYSSYDWHVEGGSYEIISDNAIEVQWNDQDSLLICVEVTNDSLCSNSYCLSPKLVTSLDHHTSNSRLYVYPNPTREYIEFRSPLSGEYLIYRYDGVVTDNGKVIENNDYKINVQNLQPGVYLLKVFSNYKYYYQKVLVH